MKGTLLVVLPLTLLGLTATPAAAATVRVNAAENITRWDSIGEFCNVAVDDFSDFEVNVYCFDDGRTWFKVRVPGVTGRITRVRVARDGDCSRANVTYRKRGDVATIKVTNIGEFDCYYSTVVVRHAG